MTIEDYRLDSHARKMDRVYRYQRYIYDITRKYYLFGRDRLIENLDVPRGSNVLEVGCGTGRNLIFAARRYSGVCFFGFDISNEMLVQARQNIHSARFSHQIKVIQGDATTFDSRNNFNLPGFDSILFSYCLSMIPDWQGALQNAVSQLSCRAKIHIVDFGLMEKWPSLFRNVMRYWLARFQVSPRSQLIPFVEELSMTNGLSVDIMDIGGGYAKLIVLSKLEETNNT